MRNPWSTEGYYGPFSDKSNYWTASYKQQVNYVNANDGKFFMPAKMYFQAFDTASVAIYDKTLTHSILKYN